MEKKNYTLFHVRAERKKGGKGKKNNTNKVNFGNNEGFSPRSGYKDEQTKGEFSFDTIHGLTLKEVEYKVPPIAERKARRNDFNGGRDQEGNIIGNGVRAAFLKMLVKTQEKVLVENLGLTERDLDGMRHGYTPNGFNVHHKLSLHGGGKNEFPNFILMPIYPHDQLHHDVIDPQIIGIQEGQARKILVPSTDEMIYDPKKFGYTKDNVAVKPNYTSKVNPEKYPRLYKPEHISVEKRQADMADFYAELDLKKAAKSVEQAKGNKNIKARIALKQKTR